jgi:ribosome-binding protein aMBF1 (putative translation factor)
MNTPECEWCGRRASKALELRKSHSGPWVCLDCGKAFERGVESGERRSREAFVSALRAVADKVEKEAK